MKQCNNPYPGRNLWRPHVVDIRIITQLNPIDSKQTAELEPTACEENLTKFKNQEDNMTRTFHRYSEEIQDTGAETLDSAAPMHPIHEDTVPNSVQRCE